MTGPDLESLGFGIAVVAFAALVNLVVSAGCSAAREATESPALEGDAAHLRTDAYTSLGVLVGLALVRGPARSGWTRRWRWSSPWRSS